MSSEAIVVLVLTALAIGFIIWVRMNSQDHEVVTQTANVVVEAEESRDR
jgi:hypothetical protein